MVRQRPRAVFIFVIVILLFAVGLGAASAIAEDRYLLISVVLVIVSMVPFFARFERKDLHAREIVLIAVLAAIAAVGRVPFAAIPSVQPTTFVVIVSGMAFGAETGFMVGALAALVSNMFLGQGPWTPWQMFAWGMAGFTAGLLAQASWITNRWVMAAFGFIWGFLFGWIMNIWTYIGLVQQWSWPEIAALYSASVLFDLAHALSNFVLLVLFGTGWLRILARFKRKYGMLDY